MKEWIPAVEKHRTNYTFKKGELIFKEGDEVKGIYFVYEGLVKVHKHWDAEKELILRFARKGDIVGHRGLGSDEYYPVSATALEPVTVCYIDLNFFKASLKVNYDFIYALMMFYAKELKDSEKNMRNLAHMSVKGRIAQALLLLQQKFGVNESGGIDLAISRQDLASFAGTTYETVFRILNEFSNEQFISTSGKDINILDKEKLNLLARD
jgi:CRP/FNR family transcriptional regulator